MERLARGYSAKGYLAKDCSPQGCSAKDHLMKGCLARNPLRRGQTENRMEDFRLTEEDGDSKLVDPRQSLPGVRWRLDLGRVLEEEWEKGRETWQE